ncbi:MAG: hypothetical protein J5582_05705 [Ruminococcus sp.]|uniref:hypothetical protein n=1 Tax=Ruminococcus sp. TaxID=41978 RepID=UPI0025F9C3C3|nr:hypothetical protein [Ruminococcus sp.]MBO4866050.1 hypothetical protein [Ruminococcus sp.]
MDKKILIAALSAAVILTACGKATDEKSGESAAAKDSSKAVTAEESSSIAEDSSEAEAESSEAEESSIAETEAPAESAPEVSSAAETDSSKAEEPAPAEPQIVHMNGTGYSFDVDLAKWVDASSTAQINAVDGSTEGIEYIFGWLGDNSSTCVLASNQTSNDISQYDIDEVAQQYIEKEAPPAGQTLIDWSTLEINGRNWIRREYTLDSSAFGAESRILQYTGFNGYTELNVCFTITETSVADIDNDLRDLMWSVQFE